MANPNPKQTIPGGRQLALMHIGTEKQCTATSKQTGVRCRRPVVKGGTVCRFHGGVMQQRAMERKKQDAKVRAYVERMGQPTPIDPTQALLEQVWEAAGNVAYLRGRVEALDERPRIGKDEEGWLRVEPGIYGPDHLGDMAPHVLVKLYNEERDRLARIAKFAIDSGIAERQVRIAEQQGQMFAAIVMAVLTHVDLALSTEQIDKARAIFGQELRKRALKDAASTPSNDRATKTDDA